MALFCTGVVFTLSIHCFVYAAAVFAEFTKWRWQLEIRRSNLSGLLSLIARGICQICLVCTYLLFSVGPHQPLTSFLHCCKCIAFLSPYSPTVYTVNQLCVFLLCGNPNAALSECIISKLQDNTAFRLSCLNCSKHISFVCVGSIFQAVSSDDVCFCPTFCVSSSCRQEQNLSVDKHTVATRYKVRTSKTGAIY